MRRSRHLRHIVQKRKNILISSPKNYFKKTYINNVKNVASFSRKSQTNVIEFSAIKLIYDKKGYISS